MKNFHSSLSRCFVFLTALALILPLAAHADGALDPHFGNQGVFIPGVPATDEQVNAIVVDSADQIYVAGGGNTAGLPAGGFSFVAAITWAGGFNTSFGLQNGATILDLGGEVQNFRSITRDAQGRLIAVGGERPVSANSHFTVVRLLSNGQLDPTFGSDGKIIMEVPSSTNSYAYAVTSDNVGNVVVAGDEVRGSKSSAMFVARFTPSGALDSSFGTGGFIYPDFGGNDEAAHAVAVDAQDRIVVAGNTSLSPSSIAKIAVARYLADGSPDPLFGNNGKVVKNAAVGEAVTSLLIDPQGRILVGGSRGSTASDMFIDRFTTAGQVDASFGNGGETATDFGGDDEWLMDMSFDRLGHVVAAGFSNANGPKDVAVARYTANGFLDSSFGNGGKKLYGSGIASEEGHAVTIDSNGRIMVGGSTFGGGSSVDILALAISASGGPAPGTCGGNPVTTLCVDHNRFRLQVRWQANGHTGSGAAIPFTDESGFFWFFDPSNIEMMTKVHEACKLAGHQWLFGAATTNVHYVLTVTDAFSGKQVVVNNPAGTLSPAITDQKTFNDCF